jgi:hypothetical protein
MDLKKILNTIASEKGEEIINQLKEKSGGLQDILKEKGGGLQEILQEKLQGKGDQPAEGQKESGTSGLESILQGKLKDFAEKLKK